jgi:hypothetical protein
MARSTDADSPTRALRLTIKPRSDFYAAHDQRAADEEFELQQALSRELPEQVRARPMPGEKGVVTDVLIPLASSGAFTAMAEVFKAWVAKRPTNRAIDVEYEIDEGDTGTRSGKLRIDSTNVDNDVLETAVREVL